MFLPPRDCFKNTKTGEFSQPVESIMRCEDFKSNFARRLSNRYIARSPSVGPKQDPQLTLHPLDHKTQEAVGIVRERIEPESQFSKNNKEDENRKIVKPSDKKPPKTEEIKSSEVTALTMEVETLKWQLEQTEANRQMHLALLKQIVSFLNRIKEHMESKKQNSMPEKVLQSRISPRSFNSIDLPRSKSVVHMNKNLEYTVSPAKKLTTRKISKSISDVNGFKDGNWKQSKLSLTQEDDSGQKITEEIARLIILANSVISTKIPDLTCTWNEINVDLNSLIPKEVESIKENQNDILPKSGTNGCLDLIEEDCSKMILLSTVKSISESFVENSFIDVKDMSSGTPSLLNSVLENDFSNFKLNDKHPSNDSTGETLQDENNKCTDFTNGSNFIEDESGFSSMSSFQEIGIPIINIIPPTPCKDVIFPDRDLDIMNSSGKWPATLEIDKQTVKVFWV